MAGHPSNSAGVQRRGCHRSARRAAPPSTPLPPAPKQRWRDNSRAAHLLGAHEDDKLLILGVHRGRGRRLPGGTAGQRRERGLKGGQPRHTTCAALHACNGPRIRKHRARGAKRMSTALPVARGACALTICCCICCIMRVLPPVRIRCLPFAAYTCGRGSSTRVQAGAQARGCCRLLLAAAAAAQAQCATHLRPWALRPLRRTSSCARRLLGCALVKATTGRAPAKAEDLHCAKGRVVSARIVPNML